MTEKNALGRNDPCHCGSGKKYKACCLEKDEQAAREARLAEQAKQEKEAKQEPAAEPASATEAPTEHAHPREPQRHNTTQPWKRSSGGPRSVPRFNAPRRSGGS